MKKVTSPSLQSVIEALGPLQVLKASEKKTSAEFLCRIVPNKDKEWLNMMEQLLKDFEASKCEVHFCRKYLLKDSKMVYAWHLGFKGSMINAYVITGKLLKPSKSSVKPNKKVPLLKGQRPIAPAYSGPDPVAPRGLKAGLTITKTKATNGDDIIYEDMQLPHIYKDLNKPAKAGGKGAGKL